MGNIESTEKYPRVTLFLEEGRPTSSDSLDALRLVRLSGLPYSLGNPKVFDFFETPALDFYGKADSEGFTAKTLKGIEQIMKSIAPDAFEKYVNGEQPD